MVLGIVHKNYLDYIPMKNPKLKDWLDEQDHVMVLLPKSKLPGRTKKIDLELDEVGSFVWQQVDGKNTIYEIGKLLKEEFGDMVDPLYERLSTYIKLLKANKLILYKK